MEKNEKISMSGIKIIYIEILFSQECTESINSNSAVVTLYDGLANLFCSTSICSIHFVFAAFHLKF